MHLNRVNLLSALQTQRVSLRRGVQSWVYHQLMSLGKWPLGFWSWDMSFVQSMQVSMGTLIVPTTVLGTVTWTESVEILITWCTHHHQQKSELRELQAWMTLKANCTFSKTRKPDKTPYKTSQNRFALKSHIPALAQVTPLHLYLHQAKLSYGVSIRLREKLTCTGDIYLWDEQGQHGNPLAIDFNIIQLYDVWLNDLNYLPVKKKMMQINFLNRLIKLPRQPHFKKNENQNK